jgi:hypothetical protein
LDNNEDWSLVRELMSELDNSVARRESMFEKLNSNTIGFTAEARRERTDKTLLRDLQYNVIEC